MQEYDIVTSLLKKHNYIVECVVNNDIVECRYADIFSISYSLSYISNNTININIKYKDKYDNIIVWAWMVRWYIFLDIIRLCRKHKLSHNIIRFFDKDGNVKDLKELLNVDMSSQDEIKELAITRPIIDILTDNNKMNDFDNYFVENEVGNSINTLKGLIV